LARGFLVLAGKTDGLGRDTFDLLILEAESLEPALDLARDSPALPHGESIEVLPLGH